MDDDSVGIFVPRIEQLRRQESAATADTATSYTQSSFGLSSSGGGSGGGGVGSGRSRQMRHPYSLHLHLIKGSNLVVRDSNGFSDPYVKLKLGRKLLAKSRVIEKSLNPRWDEHFEFRIKDVERDLELRVYDRDRLSVHDDYMGHCFLSIGQLCLGRVQEFSIDLTDETGKADEPYMGCLSFAAKLVHRLIPEELTADQQLPGEVPTADSASAMASNLDPSSSSLTTTGVNHHQHSEQHSGMVSGGLAHLSSLTSKLVGGKKQHTAVVIFNLVNGRNLLAMDDSGQSDPYVKFKLGDQKCKSRVIKETLNPYWARNSSELETAAWEKSHVVEAQLLDGAGSLRLLITITGATISSVSSDNYFSQRGRMEIVNRYSLLRTHEDVDDVGWLQVKVLRGQRLTEENHKLDATRPPAPTGERSFVFDLRDVHTWLEVAIYDENRDRKSQSKCLGRLALRLLRIANGERRWFALRDKSLEARAPGLIELEMDLIYNPVRAAVRTLNPPEEKVMQPDPKFKLALVRRNVNRFVTIIDALIDFGNFVDSCWQWENPVRSSVAFLCYMTIAWNFELHMLPCTLIVLLLVNLAYRVTESHFQSATSSLLIVAVRVRCRCRLGGDDPTTATASSSWIPPRRSATTRAGGGADKDEDAPTSWREKIKAAHGILVKVQQGLDLVASMCESVRHTFDWTEPWLSALALLILCLASVVLYIFPLRLLALAWGLNKFTKKILRPNAIDNNEVLDFLSRGAQRRGPGADPGAPPAGRRGRCGGRSLSRRRLPVKEELIGLITAIS
uniref:Multiple C2 and transmembrane domain-containing protein n=1 Tax=Macrostomum lignano TaxID=282301 RepID=A0A1I8F3Q0_9PLAT